MKIFSLVLSSLILWSGGAHALDKKCEVQAIKMAKAILATQEATPVDVHVNFVKIEQGVDAIVESYQISAQKTVNGAVVDLLPVQLDLIQDADCLLFRYSLPTAN